MCPLSLWRESRRKSACAKGRAWLGIGLQQLLEGESSQGLPGSERHLQAFPGCPPSSPPPPGSSAGYLLPVHTPLPPSASPEVRPRTGPPPPTSTSGTDVNSQGGRGPCFLAPAQPRGRGGSPHPHPLLTMTDTVAGTPGPAMGQTGGQK